MPHAPTISGGEVIQPGAYPTQGRPVSYGYNTSALTMVAAVDGVDTLKVNLTFTNVTNGVRILWGDGTVSTLSGTTASHTYAGAGTYQIIATQSDSVQRGATFVAVANP